MYTLYYTKKTSLQATRYWAIDYLVYHIMTHFSRKCQHQGVSFLPRLRLPLPRSVGHWPAPLPTPAGATFGHPPFAPTSVHARRGDPRGRPPLPPRVRDPRRDVSIAPYAI